MVAAAPSVPGISTLGSWVWGVGGMLQSGAQRGDSPVMVRGFMWEEMRSWEPWRSKASELFPTDRCFLGKLS